MNSPNAYFITFSTYGTRLRGDRRGWSFRAPGHPTQQVHGGEATFELADSARLKESPCRLTHSQRDVVMHAIRETCEYRGWSLLAVYVGELHVHVVVVAEGNPEQTMASLKAWATRKLREAGLDAARSRFWARHGSTRYLWSDLAVADVCRSVDGHG